MSDEEKLPPPITIAQAIQDARDMAAYSVEAADAITNLGLTQNDDAESKKLTKAVCKMTEEVRKLYHLKDGNLQNSLHQLTEDMKRWQQVWNHGVPKKEPSQALLNPVLPYYVYPPNCEH